MAQVQCGIAVFVSQLAQVSVHQRTVSVKIKTLVFRVVAQRVEFASEGLVIAHGATRRTQVSALLFNAYAAKLFLFGLGERDFKGWVTCLDMATTLAFGTVVKQHASTPVTVAIRSA